MSHEGRSSFARALGNHPWANASATPTSGCNSAQLNAAITRNEDGSWIDVPYTWGEMVAVFGPVTAMDDAT